MIDLDALDAMAANVDPNEIPVRKPLLPDNSAAARRVGRLDTATTRQQTAIKNMLGALQRRNPEVWSAARTFIDNHQPLTFAQASETIDRLRRQLDAPAPVDVTHTDDNRAKVGSWNEWHRLAAGLAALGGQHGARFAVDTEDGAINATAFWAIVPGKQEGKFWLRQVIGGAGAVYVRMSPEAMISVAKKIIAAGPKDAMLRYGREIGQCGHCNRTLTNDESRAFGIGPRCRKGKGW